MGSLVTILTGLGVGLMFGYVLQRGRFCMNSTFRDVIFINDNTLFRAYLLAVVVALIGANIIEDLRLLVSVNAQTGALVHEELRRQAFLPVANIVGGYLFGMGMVLAGGCGSGILYKVGEGQVAAMMGVFGFFLGVALTLNGWLNPVYEWLASIEMQVAGKDNPALWDLLGGGQKMKWGVIAAVSAIALFFIAQGKPFGDGSKRRTGYYWSVTGLLAGITVIVAWAASSYFGNAPRGLSFSGPTKEFFFSAITGTSDSSDPEFKLFGSVKMSWSALYVIGVPFGAFISAKRLKEFKWKAPSANELLTVFFGSMVMGIGAAIGGGCNVGHALTGFSTLAVSSIVTTIFIILGNWTMVYFRYIKPME